MRRVVVFLFRIWCVVFGLRAFTAHAGIPCFVFDVRAFSWIFQFPTVVPGCVGPVRRVPVFMCVFQVRFSFYVAGVICIQYLFRVVWVIWVPRAC